MRCQSCAKFVSLDFQDPEIEGSLEIDEEGSVKCSVRIVRVCAECGDEMKEATLELDIKVDVKDHVNGEGEDVHHLEVEETGIDQIEEGGGRYKKSFYGAEVNFKVTCECDEKWSLEGAMSDKIAASGMDEIE